MFFILLITCLSVKLVIPDAKFNCYINHRDFCKCVEKSNEISNFECTSFDTEIHQFPNLSYILTSKDNSNITIIVSNKNYKSIPNGKLFSKCAIYQLGLKSNKLEYIDDNIFHLVKKLNNIDLSYNKITNISNLLSSLSKLNQSELKSFDSLNLDHNFIANFDDTIVFPKSVENMKSLNLAYNQIDALKSHKIFAHLIKLKILKLNNNPIFFVSTGSFTSTVSLEHLNMHSIRIDSMEFMMSNSSNFLKNLNYLKLTFTNVHQIAYLSRLQNLIDLYMYSNRLIFIEPNQFSKKLKSLHLNLNEMETLTQSMLSGLSGLEFLNVNSNKIKLIESGSFASMISLVKLFLSRNAVKVLTANMFTGLGVLESLEIDENLIEFIDEKTFSPTKKLNSLSLARNLIKSLDQSSFLTNLRIITILNLSSQRLQSMSNRTFNVPLRQLKFLWLDNNYLTKLEPFTFSNLNGFRLTLIDLSYNQIAEIHPDAFANVLLLQTLQLSNNRLETFDIGKLNGLSGVVGLYLDNNFLSFLGTDSTQQLEKLRYIYLGSNKFYQILPSTFKSTPSLEILDISHNNLQMIKAYYFESLRLLLELHLQSNQISTIEIRSFDATKRLIKLDLSNNMIFKLDTVKLFSNLNFIQKLSLNGNTEVSKFTSFEGTIRNGFLKHLNYLTYFRIETLANDIFKSLIYLYELDMGYCSIQVIHMFAFRNFAFLDKLFLNNNRIRSLNGSLSNLTSLTNLNLSSNRLEILTESELNNLKLLKILSLDDNEIKIVEYLSKPGIILNLACLSLRNTSTNLIINTSFATLVHLEELDLSFNVVQNLDFLMKITQLKKLKLNSIKFIDDASCLFDIFRNLSLDSLTELDLSNMKLVFIRSEGNIMNWYDLEIIKLQNVGLSDFEDLNIDFSVFENITHIDLSINNIEEIKKAYFSYEIKYLNLSFNKIEFIEAGSFSKVSTLDLSYNRVFNIQTTFWQIYRFIANGNNLTAFSSKTTLDFRDMKIVSFSENKMFEIPFRLIECAKKVEILDLSSNLITVLNNNFTKTNRIFELSLHNNSLTWIDPQAIDKLRHLTTLDLSCNKLTLSDSNNTFDSLVNLKSLNLSHNLIKFVHKKLFSNFKSLILLDLSNNQIFTVEAYTFENLNVLKRLFLHENSPDLIIHKQSEVGLQDLTQLFISADILKSFSGQTYESLRTSIFELSLYKMIMKQAYFYSKQIKYFSSHQNALADSKQCLFILDFIRNNIQLNLSNQNDFDFFIKFCHQLNLRKP